MSNIKMHILVGIDFSESSNLALMRAAELAARLRARLHLCHIACDEGLVAETNLGLNIPDQFPEAKDARESLQRVLARLDASLDVEIHVRLSTSPLAGMMAFINELQPDLVIVGSHGKGALTRALLGSVSAQLAQFSPVPVCVVPAPGREHLLQKPEAAPEPELPAVGHAVANTSSGTPAYGIASIGGGEIRLR